MNPQPPSNMYRKSNPQPPDIDQLSEAVFGWYEPTTTSQYVPRIEINLNHTQTLNPNSTQINRKSKSDIENMRVTDTRIQIWELGTWNPEASCKTLPENTILLLVRCWIDHVWRRNRRQVWDLRVLGKFVASSEKRNPENKCLEMKSKQLN